jgi:hypothetical protein
MASEMPLAKKLLIKPGDTILVLGAPMDYAKLVGALPKDADIVAKPPKTGVALVHLFVTSMADLKAGLAKAQKAMAEDGGIWISWQKGGKTDVSRDTIAALAQQNGLDTVRAVSLNDEWSALKLKAV